MPIYSYKCNKCKKTIELLRKVQDANPICHECGEDAVMDRLMSLTGRPKFSGSGFYETDYKSNSKKSLDKSNVSKDKKNE